MLIKSIPVGQFEANCYVVADEATLECAVIDPGDEANTIMDYLEDHRFKVKYIFLTHGHFDHTMAANAVHDETGAPICMNKKDSHATIENAPFRFNPPEDTIWFAEGDEFHVSSLTFRVMETPGHTPGGVCLICGDAIFTGDTLFRESCGRTDLEGGDMSQLMRSLKRIGDLPGDYEVYPGHMDSSTLSRERLFNYYLRYANESVN